MQQLATALLGERLAERVIEVKRYDYHGSVDIPEFVEFYTQPELPTPVVNGICRVDVIVVEFDWLEKENVDARTPLTITRLGATTRYKAFAPPPATMNNKRDTANQAEACSKMKTAQDAFRASRGGDAQWLAEIRRQYADPTSRFSFSCKRLAGETCVTVRARLRDLELAAADEVRVIDCPARRTGNVMDTCYQLSFPYPGTEIAPQIGDYGSPKETEWIVTVVAGIRDGSAPVLISSLHVEHVPKSIPVF